jgi:hypothetical protein
MGIVEKTANKRGGTSWTWEWGAELREVNKPPAKKPHWLCKLCWDQRKTVIKGTTSTAPAIDHLAECHRLKSLKRWSVYAGRALGGDGEGKNGRHIS